MEAQRFRELAKRCKLPSNLAEKCISNHHPIFPRRDSTSRGQGPSKSQQIRAVMRAAST